MSKIHKNIFISCFFACVCFAYPLLAGDLDIANDYYAKGSFEQASLLYQSLANRNPENPYFHYNLGNCYYKMSALGKSVASFYRAFDILPRDKDIRANLSLALHAGGDTLVAGGIPVILHKLYFYFSLAELKGLFWFSLWISVFIAISYFAFLSVRKTLRPIFVMVMVFTLFTGLWSGARYLGKTKNLAVVTRQSVSVKSGPSDNFDTLTFLDEGKLVIITSQKENWYEVEIKNQAMKGWIKKDLLETIRKL